jgi:dihydropteroate synthase
MTSFKTDLYHLRGQTLDLNSPRVMGILNCTPDSFSDGGAFVDFDKAMAQVFKMINEGARIIDVGGESTRPGSDSISEEEELQRVLPILTEAIKKYPSTLFSIDTTKYEVAKQSLEAGAHLINDVSGLRKEPRFANLCADYKAGIVLMHSIGDPKTMQMNPEYDDVVSDVIIFLAQKADICSKFGIECIILDPGFGFGKNLEHNVELLKNLDRLCESTFPVLTGLSRKSMLGSILGGASSDQRLSATISAHYHALQKGAKILRVHDVQEAVDSIKVYEALKVHENSFDV